MSSLWPVPLCRAAVGSCLLQMVYTQSRRLWVKGGVKTRNVDAIEGIRLLNQRTISLYRFVQSREKRRKQTGQQGFEPVLTRYCCDRCLASVSFFCRAAIRSSLLRMLYTQSRICRSRDCCCAVKCLLSLSACTRQAYEQGTRTVSHAEYTQLRLGGGVQALLLRCLGATLL